MFGCVESKLKGFVCVALGDEVKRGEIGEVCVRGSNVTKGGWDLLVRELS